ncbi:MAG: hypothetical protein ABR607_02955 [Pyrinomonadaceae bacterium]
MKGHTESNRALSGFAVALFVLLAATGSMAQRRRAVVVRPVRHPVAARHALVVRGGHPIHRLLPREVVMHPTRRPVLVKAPLRFLPALTWRAAFVALPPRERIVWQDTETIARDEEWVDTNYGVDGNGKALFLHIDGNTQLNFAEVTYENGNVQVVDFNEESHGTGTYKILDLGGSEQHVMTIRILAKSESQDAKLAVYLSK